MSRGEPHRECDTELVGALERALSAVKDLLPAISYQLPFGTPYDRGILLIERHDSESCHADAMEKVYLAEEGFFFYYDEDGVHSYDASRIVGSGWDVSEIFSVLSKRLCWHYHETKPAISPSRWS